MKTKVLQDDPGETAASAARKSEPARRRPDRKISGGRIALLAVGIVVALLGLAALAGGAVLLLVNESERDADGFFTTATHAFRTDSHAIVTESLDIGTEGPDWLFEEGRLATIRVRGSSADPTHELFIGVARTANVQSYLSTTRYATLADFELDPFHATYRASAGTSAPAEPGSQEFWAASAEGAGTQTLEWEVSKGEWSFVVLNADGSRGVEADLSVGAKVPFIFWLGVGLVAGGAFLLASSGTMIYFSVRRRLRARATGSGHPVVDQ
jgi:hypothetical protein